MSKERPDETLQEEKGYIPASPVKRTLAWIGLAYALLFLALTTYYFYTGSMLGNLGAPAGRPRRSTGAPSLVSWRSTGRPKKGACRLLVLLCWAAAWSLCPGACGLAVQFRRCLWRMTAGRM